MELVAGAGVATVVPVVLPSVFSVEVGRRALRERATAIAAAKMSANPRRPASAGKVIHNITRNGITMALVLFIVERVPHIFGARLLAIRPMKAGLPEAAGYRLPVQRA